jgi:YVTN family beta-propeller protein
MKRVLPVIFLSFVMSSCVKTPTSSVQYYVPSAVAVYVLNQGNYGQGNSTLTAYYPDSNRAVTDVFKLANSRSLGDLGNDIAISGNYAYMVINNSDKIEVMDPTTALSAGTVYFPSGTSPYRIAFYTPGNVAYVTDLYTNSVSVVNLSANTVISQDTITVGANPYGIAYANSQIFVANSGYGAGNSVSIIDASSRKVVKTITVGAGPTEVEPDGAGNIWVACPGQPGTYGSIYIINSATDSVVDSINTGMQIPAFTGHTLAIDTQNGAAYLIADSSVVKLDVSTRQIADKNLIRGSFYAISVDEATGNIYVTDAKDYKTNGVVYVYTSGGQYTNKSFAAGINPDGIAFLR